MCAIPMSITISVCKPNSANTPSEVALTRKIDIDLALLIFCTFKCRSMAKTSNDIKFVLFSWKFCMSSKCALC